MSVLLIRVVKTLCQGEGCYAAARGYAAHFVLYERTLDCWKLFYNIQGLRPVVSPIRRCDLRCSVLMAQSNAVPETMALQISGQQSLETNRTPSSAGRENIIVMKGINGMPVRIFETREIRQGEYL